MVMIELLSSDHDEQYIMSNYKMLNPKIINGKCIINVNSANDIIDICKILGGEISIETNWSNTPIILF